MKSIKMFTVLLMTISMMLSSMGICVFADDSTYDGITISENSDSLDSTADEITEKGLDNSFIQEGEIASSDKRTNSDVEVKSINYLSGSAFVMTEHTHGYWYYTTETDDPIWIYELHYDTQPYANLSDDIEVTYADGATLSYTFNGGGEYVYYGDKDKYDSIINSDELTWEDAEESQKQNPWTVGVNYITVSYRGVKCQVPVTINESEENSIIGIEYEFAKGTDIYEQEDGWLNDGYYYYDISTRVRSNGDRLRITTDGGTETYSLNRGKGDNLSYCYYLAENGEDKIPADSVHFLDNQRVEHWKPDHTYKVTVEYADKTYIIPVTIHENKVKSIEYIPETEPVYDELQGSQYPNPEIHEHDKLCVTYEDSDRGTIEFEAVEMYLSKSIASERQKNNYMVFESENGILIDGEEICINSDQNEDKAWGPGKDNEYIITYRDKSCTLSATISGRPYINIVYKRSNGKDRKKIAEYSCGKYIVHDFSYEGDTFITASYIYLADKCLDEGDYLICTRQNKTTVKLKFRNAKKSEPDRKPGFYSDDNKEYILLDELQGRQSPYPYQYETGWECGNHEFSLAYKKVTFEVPILLVQNNIEKYEDIEFEFAKGNEPEVYKNCNGSYQTAQDMLTGEMDTYFHYNVDIDICKEGNKLVVTHSNGAKKVEYVYYNADEKHAEDGFYSSTGEHFSADDVIGYEDQKKYHWKDKGNIMIKCINFDSRVSIPFDFRQIPVKAVSLKFGSGAQLYTTEGVRKTDSNTNDEYLYYNTDTLESGTFPQYLQSGDMITVVKTDGTSTVYTLKKNKGEWNFISADGDVLRKEYLSFNDNQVETHWEPGGNNTVTVTYFDKKSDPAKIVIAKGTRPEVPHEHDWSEWDVVAEPDYDKSGRERRFCYDCDEEEYREIPKKNKPEKEPLCIKSLWASQHSVGKVLFKWSKKDGITADGWKLKYRFRKIGGNNKWSGWTTKSYSASTYEAWIPIKTDYVIEIHAQAKGDTTWSTGIITCPAGGKYHAMKTAHVINTANGKRLAEKTVAGSAIAHTAITLKVGQTLSVKPAYDYDPGIKDYKKRPRLYPSHMLYDIGDKSMITITKPDKSTYTGGIIDGAATIKATKIGKTAIIFRSPNGRTMIADVTITA